MEKFLPHIPLPDVLCPLVCAYLFAPPITDPHWSYLHKRLGCVEYTATRKRKTRASTKLPFVDSTKGYVVLADSVRESLIAFLPYKPLRLSDLQPPPDPMFPSFLGAPVSLSFSLSLPWLPQTLQIQVEDKSMLVTCIRHLSCPATEGRYTRLAADLGIGWLSTEGEVVKAIVIDLTLVWRPHCCPTPHTHFPGNGFPGASVWRAMHFNRILNWCVDHMDNHGPVCCLCENVVPIRLQPVATTTSVLDFLLSKHKLRARDLIEYPSCGSEALAICGTCRTALDPRLHPSMKRNTVRHALHAQRLGKNHDSRSQIPVQDQVQVQVQVQRWWLEEPKFLRFQKSI